MDTNRAYRESLKWPWAKQLAFLFVGTIVLGLLVFFDWFGGLSRSKDD